MGGGTPVDPDLVVTTYGGKQIIDPRIIINDTGGIQYPTDYDLPNHTGGNISNNLLDKKSSILTGGEIEVGHWSDNVLSRDHRLPIPEPTIANNGLKIESNPKHTPGTIGYGRQAGTEPRNSKELFEKSIPTSDPLVRLSIDDNGNIHRFTNNNKKGEYGKDIYHWAGSTGDKSAPMTQRELRKFNPEVKDLNQKYKGK